MYITGERGDSALLINSIRTWGTPELMMKYLYAKYKKKLETLKQNNPQHAQSYLFTQFLDGYYKGIRVYFSPTNSDEKVKLMSTDELLALARELKYIQPGEEK